MKCKTTIQYVMCGTVVVDELEGTDISVQYLNGATLVIFPERDGKVTNSNNGSMVGASLIKSIIYSQDMRTMTQAS